MSLWIRPYSWTSFLCFTLFHLAMKPAFSASSAVGSQGRRSPSSRYQKPFVRCETAASTPYVSVVSKPYSETVTPASDYYNYRAYLETIPTYGVDQPSRT